jgi:hypothetical protein
VEDHPSAGATSANDVGGRAIALIGAGSAPWDTLARHRRTGRADAQATPWPTGSTTA